MNVTSDLMDHCLLQCFNSLYGCGRHTEEGSRIMNITLDLIRSLIVLTVFAAMVEMRTRFKLLCTSYVH